MIYFRSKNYFFMMDEPENQSSTDTEGEISENEANIENLEHVPRH